VNGGNGHAGAVKKPKKESKLPKLPGGVKKKKTEGSPPEKPTTDKKTTIVTSTSTSVSTPFPGGPPPPSGPPPPPSLGLGVDANTSQAAGIEPDDGSGSDMEEKSPEHNVPSAVTLMSPPVSLVTIYAYDATEENELSFGEGETILLIEKDDSGWWRGRNQKGEEGVFPSNFVEVVGEEGAATSGTVTVNADFQALYDYYAEDETELTIKEGEILHVISETDGWYYGSNAQGQQGNFPSNFVEPLESMANHT